MKKITRSRTPAPPALHEGAVLSAPVSVANALADDLAALTEIREGLPIEAFDYLREQLQVSAAELGEVVGLPLRTLQRRRAEGRLAKDESDRLQRVQEVQAAAAALFGPSGARSWLTRPQSALAGARPLAFCDTGPGAREVVRVLGRLDHGVLL